MTTLISLSLVLVSSAMIARWVLILAGMLKGPVLATYELYGAESPFFFPLPYLLIWLGTLILGGGWLVRGPFSDIDFPAEVLGGLFLFVGAMLHMYRDPIAHYLRRATPLPRWANHLVMQTTRVERRRIAFMWLRLPLRTRLLYNYNTAAFFKWTELVILATV